jgi:hypothetical protein
MADTSSYLRRILATMLFIVASAPIDVAAGERMVDLFRRGYQVIANEPYLSFEACEFDKAIPIGDYIFKCQTYEYVYYGKAEVLGRTFVVKGQSISSAYLCAGEDHCMAGALYAR